jgi:phosphofructokinase-like protein
MAKQKIGILTGGGDCPGLNAVIRGVAKTAINVHDMEVVGFLDGFLGMLERHWVELTYEKVSGILTQGGTILGTTNRDNPFACKIKENGIEKVVDLSDRCVATYKDLGLQALVCLGGDGTMGIAGELAAKGINVVGVPKTIDKDVVGTDITFGFDSARELCTEAIDRLHTTAASHHRVMLVEVMGRNAGWLALESGIAGGGDIILIPEVPYSLDKIVEVVARRNKTGRKFSIVVVAEGAHPAGGQKTYQGPEASLRLGGVSHTIAADIEKASGIECRVTVLGHLQRGGTPTAFDRLLATQFAVKAVELVVKGDFNRMVAMKAGQIDSVPIADILHMQRKIPLDSPLINIALAMGTSLGADISN